MKIYLRLLKYIKPYTGILLLELLFSVLLSSVNVAIIPTIGKLSSAIGAQDFNQLNMYIAVALGLFLLKSACTFANSYFGAHADLGITRDMRMEMFGHIQDLSLDFYSKTRTGEIITIIMNDINMMQSVIISSFTSILPGFMTLIGVMGYLFKLNWRLSLICLFILPFVTLISAKFGRGARDVAQATQEKVADIISILHEVVTGAKIVKSFTMEQEEIERFGVATNHMKDISLRANLARSSQLPLFNFIQTVAAIVVIWFGGSEILAGRMSPSSLIAFFSGVLILGDPLGDLSRMNISIQMALASAKRYFRVLDTIPTVEEAENAKEATSLNGEVIFDNVSFKYESNKNMILNNINISCKAGEILAVVGHSGAGKSTLVGLIPRFYDAVAGKILIDGQDIRDYKLMSLRKFIGIVPQETLLFSGTIRDNIAYGKKNAADKEIEEVAKMANAHDFIMSFPDKYKTLIGEKGIRLSGGERQRVAIARAFLRDPRILILDEATSSLDSQSEHLVQEALEKLMNERTTFVIAHRLSTVRFANRIIVLKSGSIIEQGSHSELMAKKGAYRRMYEMQTGSFTKLRPKVFGFLETSGLKITYGGINVLRGWILADDNSQIGKVRIVCENKVVGVGKTGIIRPNVNKAYPNFAHSLNSGFMIKLKTGEDPGRSYVFEAFDTIGRKIKKNEFKLEAFNEKGIIAL